VLGWKAGLLQKLAYGSNGQKLRAVFPEDHFLEKSRHQPHCRNDIFSEALGEVKYDTKREALA
jgi:hypothetical protein